jgi:hypothetical protein
MTDHIVLHMEPKTPPVSWKEFLKNKYPCQSIALDGYVTGGPRFDAGKLKQNFNHHEDVDRLATRSTCAQILMATRQGLFDCFKCCGKNQIHVYANDCDQDVCTSWFLIKNHEMIKNSMNPLINRLVYMEDMLDSTAGAYPFPPTLKTLEHFAWIFYPYTKFRLTGGIDRRDPNEFMDVVNSVEKRIWDHVMGNAETIALETDYEVIGGGKGWSMVKEIGQHARTAMFADGIKAFVSVRERKDGNFSYVYGKMSSYIPFNLFDIYETCNMQENCTTDRHGGSDIIGGSPRINGSKITPEEMQTLINLLIFTQR